MMTIEHLPIAATEEAGGSLVTNLRARAAAWLRTCADYRAASAMYENLVGLSDAELHRRGLSRDTIAREAINVCTRDE
jgi:hypothetical protein